MRVQFSSLVLTLRRFDFQKPPNGSYLRIDFLILITAAAANAQAQRPINRRVAHIIRRSSSSLVTVNDHSWGSVCRSGDRKMNRIIIKCVPWSCAQIESIALMTAPRELQLDVSNQYYLVYSSVVLVIHPFIHHVWAPLHLFYSNLHGANYKLQTVRHTFIESYL